MSALTPDETILGVLLAQPQHGYQLLDAFHDPQRLGKVWSLSTSQLYAVLKRLEREGWITGRQIDSANAPTRTEYAITQSGCNHVMTWLHEPNPSPSIRRVRVEFLSRLYVAHLLRLPTHAIIVQQRSVCAAERSRMLSSQDTAGFGGLASALVIAQLDAVLGWIDHISVHHQAYKEQR